MNAPTPIPIPAQPAPPWAAREIKRLQVGAYRAVPWHDQPWVGKYPHHYAHLSRESAGLIAYTHDDSKGQGDIQTSIRPGRYLTRYFSDTLTPEEINRWANLCNPDAISLKFTTSLDQILTVYRARTLSACMSKGTADFHLCGKNHPLLPYSNHQDLSLAFIQNTSGEYLARTLVIPSRKVYTRIYGNSVLMEAVLQGAGWTPGTLDGIVLPAYPIRGSGLGLDLAVLCPFIDHLKWATLDPRAATLTLSMTATGTTHSVQHTYGVAFAISQAPNRQWGDPDVKGDWLRSITAETGTTPTTFPCGLPATPKAPAEPRPTRTLSSAGGISLSTLITAGLARPIESAVATRAARQAETYTYLTQTIVGYPNPTPPRDRE